MMIAKEIVQRLPSVWRLPDSTVIRPKIKTATWPAVLDKVRSGEADIVVASVTYIPEREKQYRARFSIPYHVVPMSLVGKSTNIAGTLESILPSKRVGFARKTTAEDAASQLAPFYDFTQVAFESAYHAVIALEGEVHFVLADEPFLTRALQELGDSFRRINLPADEVLGKVSDFIINQRYVVAVPENAPELQLAVNEILAGLKGPNTDGESLLDRMKRDAQQEWNKVLPHK